MEIILISILGGLMLFILFVLLIILIKAMKNKNSSLSSENSVTQESLKLLSEEIKNFTMEKNENVKSDLKQLITSETSQLPEIRQKIENVNSLLFQNNKAGKSGEYLLERIFENISGELNNKNIIAEKQYKLIKKTEDGKALIVDLLLKGEGSRFPNIAIDSKFSIKAFDNIINDETSENIAGFKDAIKKKINETKKYVSIEDNIPYAIMFIPSESIATYINNKFPELLDFAFQNKVIIASPTSLCSILFSIENYMSLFEKIHGSEKVIEGIKILTDRLSKNDQYYKNLKKGIDTMNKAWKDINDNYDNLYDQFIKIKGEIYKNGK